MKKPPPNKIPSSLIDAALPNRPNPPPDHEVVLRTLRNRFGYHPGLDGWGGVSVQTLASAHQVDEPHIRELLDYLASTGALDLEEVPGKGGPPRLRIRLQGADDHLNDLLLYIGQRVDERGWWRPRGGHAEIRNIGPRAVDAWRHLLERGYVEVDANDGLAFRVRDEPVSAEPAEVIAATFAAVRAERELPPAPLSLAGPDRNVLQRAAARCGVRGPEPLRLLITFWASTWEAENHRWSSMHLLRFARLVAESSRLETLPPALRPRMLVFHPEYVLVA